MVSPARLPVLILALAGCGERAPAPPPPSPASVASPAAPAPAPRRLPPEPGLALPGRFTALGTEPFWAAAVDGDSLRYRTPEDQAGQQIAVTRRAAGESVVVTGTLGEAPLRLAVTAGPCSDGMSDAIYPYMAELTIAGRSATGCARPG